MSAGEELQKQLLEITEVVDKAVANGVVAEEDNIPEVTSSGATDSSEVATIPSTQVILLNFFVLYSFIEFI
jgi:hypothetical protein